jgi:tyrosinase
LELDYRSSIFACLAFKILMAASDAPDFFESSFWYGSDPVSGLGGWGDPNSDWEVPDGAFSTIEVAYPVPHIVRREYTYQPFDSNDPLFLQPLLVGNASFSASVIQAILGTAAGDYKGFQTMLEAVEVRAWICCMGFLIPML